MGDLVRALTAVVAAAEQVQREATVADREHYLVPAQALKALVKAVAAVRRHGSHPRAETPSLAEEG